MIEDDTPPRDRVMGVPTCEVTQGRIRPIRPMRVMDEVRSRRFSTLVPPQKKPARTKLANFKAAKSLQNRELDQLCQLFSMFATTLLEGFDGTRRLEQPHVRANPDELDQAGQLQSQQKPTKQGTRPTSPTFFDVCDEAFGRIW